MSLTQDKIIVTKLDDVNQYRVCQEIQRRAWGLRQDGYLVPVATLVAVNKYGGLVLGAWRAERMVGFSFAFLGRVRAELVLYSQLTATLPEEQGSGVGYALKTAQREWARSQGLAKIVWAFDPLQLGNANFNLHKLGAYSQIYETDMYGERNDALNAGLPATDRLIAEWDTFQQTSQSKLKLEECRPVFLTEREGTIRRVLDLQLAKIGQNEPLSLEIPGNLRVLVETSPEEARHWQTFIREAFQKLFALGYRATDFVRLEEDGERRGWYLLSKS